MCLKRQQLSVRLAIYNIIPCGVLIRICPHPQ